jgi:hypothetical protein
MIAQHHEIDAAKLDKIYRSVTPPPMPPQRTAVSRKKLMLIIRIFDLRISLRICHG